MFISCARRSLCRRESARRVFGIVILLAVVATVIAGVRASQRTSASYAMAIDSIGCGGGRAVSASYRELDSAIAQESACGATASAGYRDNAGVVQYWGAWAISPQDILDYLMGIAPRIAGMDANGDGKVDIADFIFATNRP
ncbi:MAG: hypothetical protein NTX50_18340 [Candidatus Sumerlaeota bacterium]|nr:hypothetical protein [Candidatus Sumerlaeota bacterium]